MQQRGLGRGLSAFFNESIDIEKQEDITEKSDDSISVIDINLIKENPFQPRKIFNDDAVESLARSIKEHGLLQPILVQRHQGNKFLLIAGERRLRAAKLAKLDEVPCIICHRQYTDKELLEIAILENIQRENLDIIEEAEAYKKLIEGFKQTQEQISETTGKSRSHIANVLRLNALPNTVKNLIHEKKITFGHARALVGIQDAEMLAEKIASEDLSVRQVEKIVKDKKLKFQQDGGIYEEKSEENEIRYQISSILNMDVKVKLKGNGGAIEIKFDNSNELDRFMQIISQSS